MEELQRDPDIVAEAGTLRISRSPTSDVPGVSPSAAPDVVKLIVRGNTYQSSEATAALLQEIGGLPALRRMTQAFYPKMFADGHLDQFVRNHDDPHPERLATWIAEKMGGGTPWTDERRKRPQARCPLSHNQSIVVHDRSSAHFAAWFSPKRDPRVAGDHFNLEDARNWMRLMFWAARETGLLDNSKFADWYIRFIAHFVRVYERMAPQFARESARWSANPSNIERYLADGRSMKDIQGLRLSSAINSLPLHEQGEETDWPYEQ